MTDVRYIATFVIERAGALSDKACLTSVRSIPTKIGLALVALLTTATLFVGAPATADRRAFLDKDDSPGPLDLVAATHRHKTTEGGAELLVHGAVTYEEWASEDFGWFIFGFNTDADERFERHLRVHEEDGELVAEIYRQSSDKGIVGYGKVWRPDEHSFKVSFPTRLLKHGHLTEYRWYVYSRVQTEEPACQLGCYDYLPRSPFGPHPRSILHDVQGT